jgi:very-short-patch-repair endonuclease
MRAGLPKSSAWEQRVSDASAILYVDTGGRIAATDPLSSVFRRCESPIEERLARSLARSGFYAMANPFRFETVERHQGSRGGNLFFWVQEPMLRYRVDFLIAYYDPTDREFSRLIVECDGHDYHSPIQAQNRDQSRDRELRPHVAGIVHLTGAEIMRDPDAAAGRLVALLMASATIR